MTVEGQLGRSLGFEAACVSALAVIALLLVSLAFIEVGPLSTHMLVHVGTMNILAPLLAAVLAATGWLTAALGRAAILWWATALQMVLLWAWHSHAIQHVAHSSATVAVALHAALLIAALIYWCAVIVSSARPWQTILALLISGKLACLLGALLVFSPRLLLPMPAFGESAISDQHLAGLIMLAACPLSYILAAIVLTAQEISRLQTQSGKIHRDRFPVGG